MGEEPRDPRGEELRQRSSDLEQVVAMATVLPRRPPGPLTFPVLKDLRRR